MRRAAASCVVLALLSGAATGAAYDVTPSPAAVDFGTVAPGNTSGPQTVTFTNPFSPGVSWNLSSPAVVITGANASDFTVASTTCATLLNASCTATVTFTPSATGTRDGVVQLIQSTGEAVSASTLTGTSVAAASLITSTQSGFVDPTTGSPSPGVVTFTNTSPVTITFGRATVSGGPFAPGSVDACSGASIAAGGSCGIALTFSPTSAGRATAQVSLPSSGLTGAAATQVSATAVTPEPPLPFYSGSVPICHAAGGSGKYVPISPNYASIVGGRGHGGHARDIIPAFRYPGGTYAGRNWPPTGAAARSACVQRLLNGPAAPVATQTNPPQPPVAQTVRYCRWNGSAWQSATRTTAEVYGSVQPRDIVPPFTLQANGLSIAFPGQNWDADGRAVRDNNCAEPAPRSPLEPAQEVTLCGAPVDGAYPRLSMSPTSAVGYARANPTAIIPPFTYRSGTSTRRFQGLNWSSRGQRIFADGCIDANPPLQAITPSVQCVAVQPDGTLTAYFDVRNLNATTVTVPAGPGSNVVTGSGFTAPTPPAAFAPGAGPRVLTVTGIPRSSSATWTITSGGVTRTAVASGLSPTCAVPAQPLSKVGVFVSCIAPTDNSYTVVFGYENAGTAPVTIAAGVANAVVVGSEGSGSAPNRGQTTVFAPGRHATAFQVQGVPRGALISWIVQVGDIAPGTDLALATRSASSVVPDGAPACTSTAPTPTVVPPTTNPPGPGTQPPDLTSLKPIGVSLTCVRDNRDGSFDAVFGYSNPNPVTITAPAGPLNQVSPAIAATGADQGQVQDFAPGSVDSAWTAQGVPVGTIITWRVGSGAGAEASAGIGSAACPGSVSGTPTITGGGGPPIPPQPDLKKSDIRIGVFTQCVRLTGKTYSASFGYEMTGGVGSASVPAGRRNRIAPATFRITPPTAFSAGRHESVFTVDRIPLGKSVTWTIRSPGGTVASATSEANGPNCVSQKQPPVPALQLSVTPPSGPTIIDRPQPQPVVVKNVGTATANGVVVVVPSAGGQVIRPTASTGTSGARCSRIGGSGVVQVGRLLPGESARCVLRVTADRCDAASTTVRASATARRLDNRIGARSGTTGRRAGCAAPGSGVTG